MGVTVVVRVVRV
jgi:hypothetical protein